MDTQQTALQPQDLPALTMEGAMLFLSTRLRWHPRVILLFTLCYPFLHFDTVTFLCPLNKLVQDTRLQALYLADEFLMI